MSYVPPRLYVVTESQSRYGLLGAFGTQLARAMQRAGLNVNGDSGGPASWTGKGRAGYVFFNNASSVDDVYGWAGPAARPGHDRGIVQWCVDHPLTIEAEWLDAMSKDAGFRLLTVTGDDSHLLALRFPNLKHATVWHGVDPSALCDAASIEASHAGAASAPTAQSSGRWHGRPRDIDVLIAGSIPAREELAQLRARVPQALHRMCDDIVALRLEHSAMSFGQAVDVALPAGMRANDQWKMLAALFAYTTAAVGRARRTAVVRALRGLNVAIVGTEAWKDYGRGTHRYLGNAGYEEIPGLLARAKVCLAVSPPQFATGFSERVLLSMAAGCATVAEERLAITREFCTVGGGPVRQYPADRPEMARVFVEKLLGDEDERVALGTAGRAMVAARHLWDFRVEKVLMAAGLMESAAPAGVAGDLARTAA